MQNMQLNGSLNSIFNNISENNSSNIPLNSGETFIGSGETNGYDNVLVFVKTDVDGILYVELGIDVGGTIFWDTSIRYVHKFNHISVPHNLVKGSRYFRVRFENTSNENQSYFRLISTYGTFNALSISLNQTLAQNYDAISTRPTDNFSEVSLGRREGVESFIKYGYNLDFNTTPEILAAFGGTYTPMLSGESLQIESTSGDDTIGGVGANSLLIIGLDENRMSQTEIIEISGTSSINTVKLWCGINEVMVYTVGNTTTNVGTISLTSSSFGIQGSLPIGTSITKQLIFHSAKNTKALVYGYIFDATKSLGVEADVEIKAYVYNHLNGVKIEAFDGLINTGSASSLIHDFRVPFTINPSSTWWVEVSVSGGDGLINGRVLQILYEVF